MHMKFLSLKVNLQEVHFCFISKLAFIFVGLKHQVTNVCEDCNNFQDSKPIFMINVFQIFPIMFLRQLNFDVLLVKQLFYVYYKGKTPLFYNLQFLLSLSERGLSSESCLAFCYPMANCL